MGSKRLVQLTFWIVLFQSIGFLSGLMTQTNIYPWYEQLNKSALTPPGFVFSIVWTILYVLLAMIAWILSDHNELFSRKLKLLFGLQMIMNWLWTPLFFEFHWIRFSAIWLLVLSCLNLYLILETRKIHQIISWLLAPYVLWLFFASYLNGVIALVN